jgi:hypothetical protein
MAFLGVPFVFLGRRAIRIALSKMRKSQERTHMKLMIIAAMTVMCAVAACGQKTADEKINEQIKDKLHSLTAEERLMAETNAKQFFNKQFPAKDGEMKPGVWTECKPSDSNFNGLVTCSGYVPSQVKDIMDVVTRYCGYTKDLVGCSTEDTVK